MGQVFRWIMIVVMGAMSAFADDHQQMDLQINFLSQEYAMGIFVNYHGIVNLRSENGVTLISAPRMKISYPKSYNQSLDQKLARSRSLQFIPTGVVPNKQPGDVNKSNLFVALTDNDFLIQDAQSGMLLKVNSSWLGGINPLSIEKLSVYFNQKILVLSYEFSDHRGLRSETTALINNSQDQKYWNGAGEILPLNVNSRFVEGQEFSSVVDNVIKMNAHLFSEKSSSISPSTNGKKIMDAFSASQSKPVESADSVLDKDLKGTTNLMRQPKQNVIKDLKLLRQRLTQLIPNQPELIQSLMQIEMQNAMRLDKSQKSDQFDRDNNKMNILYLSGLVGSANGLAEAVVQARGERLAKVTGEIVSTANEEHIFNLPVVKEEKDVWKITGVTGGYVSSNSLSSLNRFIVKHSAGRYKIETKKENDNIVEYVEVNPDWVPGTILPGYFSPEQAIIVVDQFQEWSKEMKDRVLVPIFKSGRFEIGNPGNTSKSVKALEASMTFFIQTTEAQNMISARDQNGHRIGAPLSYDELKQNWERARSRIDDFIELVKRGAGGVYSKAGTSDELVGYIPKTNFILLKPASEEELRMNLRRMLTQMLQKFSVQRDNGIPKLNISVSEKLFDFILNYDHLAEEGSSQFLPRLETFIQQPILDLIESGKLNQRRGTIQKLNMDVIVNADGTASLQMNNQIVPLQITQKDRLAQPISDDEIDRLIALEDRINHRVRGVESIVKQVVADIRRSQNTVQPKNPYENKKRADVYMFLGVSSTGKTEFIKVLHEELYKTDQPVFMISGNELKSMESIENLFLGRKDHFGNVIESNFMKAYHRANGDLIVGLDEISNAHPEILKIFYDLMREPVLKLIDGKPYPMNRVKIILTGNAGEEWYKDIPRNIPEQEQYKAARDIYESAVRDQNFQRGFLLKYFTEAFLNRVGFDRIFFFGPHTHRTIRELIQSNLIRAVKNFSKDHPSIRSWDVTFATAQDYKSTIEDIQKYGFKIWEQGASINRFIEVTFLNAIHDALITHKISQRSHVRIVKTQNSFRAGEVSLGYDLLIEGDNGLQKIPLKLQVQKADQALKESPQLKRLTAYHEAGHEVVRQILLREYRASGGVSIIPGVKEIDGRFVSFEGIAFSKEIQNVAMTREAVLAEIAVLLAGGEAERAVSRNVRMTSGVQNDYLRATKLAQYAVAAWGLSAKWSYGSIDPENFDREITGFSQKKKLAFEKLVAEYLDEGRMMARKTVIANLKYFIEPIANHLARYGEVDAKTLTRFYQSRLHLQVHPADEVNTRQLVNDYEKAIAAENQKPSGIAIEFYSFLSAPRSVVDLKKIVESQYEKEVAKVDLSAGHEVTAKKIYQCQDLFKAVN